MLAAQFSVFSECTKQCDKVMQYLNSLFISVPAAPEITSVMNRSSSEVLVEWVINVPGIDVTDEPGAITRYTIYVDDNGGVNTADGTVLSYIIRNLDPYQLVMVQVSASTSAGEGARSAAETGRSSEARRYQIRKLCTEFTWVYQNWYEYIYCPYTYTYYTSRVCCNSLVNITNLSHSPWACVKYPLEPSVSLHCHCFME